MLSRCLETTSGRHAGIRADLTLLEVEPGFPVTLVYGANEVHYVVNVLKLEVVPIGHS